MADLDRGIRQVDIDKEMQQSYLDYAMSVIISRALPDARDGLKPVHRRLLYTMFKGRAKFSPETVETLGGSVLQYHPHGNLGMKDIIAGMAQKYSNNVPLFDAHGNAGTKDIGNNPSAGRYWKVSLSKQFQKRTVHKTYVTAVTGTVVEEQL